MKDNNNLLKWLNRETSDENLDDLINFEEFEKYTNTWII